MRNAKTVSGRARIRISLTNGSLSSNVAIRQLPPFLCFGRSFEALKAIIPERLQEGPYFRQPLRASAIEALGPHSPLGHQPCSLQHAKVLRDGRTRDRKMRGDLP